MLLLTIIILVTTTTSIVIICVFTNRIWKKNFEKRLIYGVLALTRQNIGQRTKYEGLINLTAQSAAYCDVLKNAGENETFSMRERREQFLQIF